MIPARTITGVGLIGLIVDRFIPVMICRMIISLKKVASSQRPPCMSVELSARLPTNPSNPESSALQIRRGVC